MIYALSSVIQTGNLYEQYIEIKGKLQLLLGSNEAVQSVILFGNPCTMQIIIAHFANILLTSHVKGKNAKVIEEYTGICGYKGKEVQRKQLFSLITVDNYKDMLTVIAQLPSDDMVKNSTNLDHHFKCFESFDDSWVSDINMKLEQDK